MKYNNDKIREMLRWYGSKYPFTIENLQRTINVLFGAKSIAELKQLERTEIVYYNNAKTTDNLEWGICDAADHVEELQDFINKIFAVKTPEEFQKLKDEWYED